MNHSPLLAIGLSRNLSVALLAVGRNVDHVLIVSDLPESFVSQHGRNTLKEAVVEAMHQRVLTIAETAVSKDYCDAPVADKSPKRTNHWQRHDRLPFYATAPCKKRHR